MFCEIVIEFAQAPERASRECQVRPDGEGDESNCERGGGHMPFWRSKLRYHNGNADACSYAKSSARIGRRRRRLPVAAKMALPTAGATTGKPGSPMPVGSSLLMTKCTSILGISLMRGMS